MTDRLPALMPKQLIRVLTRLGFVLHRQRGSHAHYRHKDDRTRWATVPMHPGTLKRGTMMGILKQAGISKEEFLKNL